MSDLPRKPSFSAVAPTAGRASPIGYAVPINRAKAILPQLKEAGHVTRAWLGIYAAAWMVIAVGAVYDDHAAWRRQACLFAALNSLKEEDLGRAVYIRNQGHSVVDAINRQLCHYAYHVGQIVFVGKLMKKEEWSSLSIPRDQSGTYNKDKFSQEKGMRHFTDEFLKKRE